MVRLALLFAFAAAASSAAAQVLTLEAARSRALAQQPALAALELNARAIEEAAPAEGALPDPRLKLGLLNFPTRNFPQGPWEDMTQFMVTYEQMIPGGEKRRLRESRALAEAEQARAESHGQRQAIRRDVALAWLDAWQALAAARLAKQLAGEYRRAIELAQVSLGAGRGSQAEVLGARQMLAQVDDRALELQMQAERARSALRRWVPDAGAFELPPELPAWREPAPLAGLAADLERLPQHAALVKGQSLAEADVALAREATSSDKTVELAYGKRQGSSRSDMVSVQFTFELPVFAERKQDRVLESKLKAAERVREQRADQLRQLRAELEAAYAEWRIAGERLANYHRATLPAASARLETLLAAQAAGRAELAQVFDARRQLIEAGLQELALRTAQAKARAGIEYFELAPEERK
jgi:outer membrane protein TolC